MVPSFPPSLLSPRVVTCLIHTINPEKTSDTTFIGLISMK